MPDQPRPSQPASPSPASDEVVVHHQSRRSRRRRTTKVGDLKLTSMLDVCFQLLIFFVLTASFAPNEGILRADLPLGQGVAKEDVEPPEEPLRIGLISRGGSDVSIQVSSVPEAFSDFAQLHSVLQQMPDWIDRTGPVFIEPDATVPWSAVVDAFNAAIRAQYTNVSFTPPKTP